MSIVGGVVIFVVTWILVLFMVLPWGVRTQEESDEEVEPGTVESAPVNPRIWTKFAITTGITVCFFVIILTIFELELIDFRAFFQGA
jgi:predicted secreted protein